jgi:oxygen-independent coproporphyrinogen-3 oxidase
VNRLSIGIQSFRDAQLRRLGRVHGAADARRAIELATRAGFDNINLDLMYGLPGDDVAGAITDLEQALAFGSTHLSWYQLTLEPNTAFERRPPVLPNEGEIAEIESEGRAMLAAAGYERYEISAYAQPSRRCEHNLNYWRFGDYLGLGAGAHGKVTLAGEFAIERRAKTRNPRTYMQNAGTAAAVTLERIDSAEQAALEFLINALRLLDGVTDEDFAARTGQPAAIIRAARQTAIRQGWLSAEPGVLRSTPAGLQVLNQVLELFA